MHYPDCGLEQALPDEAVKGFSNTFGWIVFLYSYGKDVTYFGRNVEVTLKQ